MTYGAKSAIIGILVYIFLSGCAQAESGAWFRPVPGEKYLELDAHPLPRGDFSTVHGSYVEEAVASLKHEPWRILQTNEAEKMADHPLQLRVGIMPYLVRSLSYRQPTGNYGVDYFDGDLLVYYGMLGRGDFKIYQEALIVLLPEPPRELYVICSSAQ